MSRHRRSHGRDVDGIVLLNKPTGMSSNFALQRVKQVFNANKAGHTGALDPLATGMLPICLGEATKFSQLLLESDKSYEVTACLGIRTNTSDADGEVISSQEPDVTEEQVREALHSFEGDIMQVPSMFSALKHNGRPLYEYAREGIVIERPARPITVYEISLISFNLPFISLKISCSKGTYVRTIVDDLGELLGCGAHVTELNRTQVANYPRDKMITLEELEETLNRSLNQEEQDRSMLDRILLPLDSAVSGLDEIAIPDQEVFAIVNGRSVKSARNTGGEREVRLYTVTGHHFLGVADLSGGLIRPRRLVRTAEVLDLYNSLVGTRGQC